MVARLPQALRHRARRLRHPAAHPEGQCALVLSGDRYARRLAGRAAALEAGIRDWGLGIRNSGVLATIRIPPVQSESPIPNPQSRHPCTTPCSCSAPPATWPSATCSRRCCTCCATGCCRTRSGWLRWAAASTTTRVSSSGGANGWTPATIGERKGDGEGRGGEVRVDCGAARNNNINNRENMYSEDC